MRLLMDKYWDAVHGLSSVQDLWYMWWQLQISSLTLSVYVRSLPLWLSRFLRVEVMIVLPFLFQLVVQSHGGKSECLLFALASTNLCKPLEWSLPAVADNEPFHLIFISSLHTLGWGIRYFYPSFVASKPKHYKLQISSEGALFLSLHDYCLLFEMYI